MINQASFLGLLEPGFSNIWMNPFPQRALEWSSQLNTRTAGKAVVHDHKLTGFGSLVYKPEGQAIVSLDPIDGQTKNYTPVRFGGYYNITQEMQDHELYGIIMKFETDLMGSAIDGQETIAANWMNGAFGTTDADGYSSTGFDGLQLCSTAHTRLDGGPNIANRPAADGDLSLTGVQNAVIAFENLKNDRGRTEVIRPMKLIVSPEDRFTAREILNSEYKPGTANNDINALQDDGLSFFVSHYKTDNNSWFVMGDKHDVNYIWDVKPRTAVGDLNAGGAFFNEVIPRKCVQGFVVGFGEWRGVFGSNGH